jgi:peptide/nickel transport system permease protein
MEYLEAAQIINCSVPRTIIKHILPNSISPIIVSVTMGIGNTILMAASLSYIGLGIQPPTPEWGAMLSAARTYMRDYPHMVLFPGIAIGLIVLSLNMLGDGLRDALDPKLKK